MSYGYGEANSKKTIEGRNFSASTLIVTKRLPTLRGVPDPSASRPTDCTIAMHLLGW
jgi:hypothetical protein